MKVTCKPSDPHEPLLCSDLRKFQSFSPGRHAFVHYVSLFRVIYSQVNMILTMLVLDARDEMYWWQLEDVGDGFGHQYPISKNRH